MTADELTKRVWEAWCLVQRLSGAEAVLNFVTKVSPRFMRPNHLRALATVFAAAAAIPSLPIRAVVSVPPRHSKTETVIHALVWWLMLHPHKTCAYITYSADLAFSKSNRMRDIARRAGIIIREDQNKVAEWRTPAGGGLLATGIGGPLTGHGVDLMVLDDPIKNREEAESSTIREKNMDWFTSTAMTRIEPGGSVIVQHTRWHPDDMIGTLLKEDEERVNKGEDAEWTNISLPALSPTGLPLWPERWPLSELERKRREVGEYDWASLFMCSPRVKGNAIFREPARYELARVLGRRRIFIACDPAATEKTSADFSAIVVGAAEVREDRLLDLDILDVKTMQVGIPALARELEGLQLKWGGAPIVVEAQGAFKSVAQMLRAVNRNLRVYEVTARSKELAPEMRGDKFQRAQPVAAAWNDGRVRVPLEAPWVGSFLAEVTSFTGVKDAHDDQVDALAHLYNFSHRMLLGRQRATTNVAPGLAWG